MKKVCYLLIIAFVIACIPNLAKAEVTFKGHMFGDYYYVLKHSSFEEQHGFWFRRIYFTAEAKIVENVKTRLRLELANSGKFTEKDKITPVVKDAYLQYTAGNHKFLLGIISTPTWGSVEKVWGYRSLEKTPLDLYKLGSSRDFGIAAKGALDKNKMINYMVMYGNGASNKEENNKYKKVYGALTFKPVKGLTLEGYGDYEYTAANTVEYVIQAFGSYAGSWGRIGAMYAFNQLRTSESPTETWDFKVISAFAVLKLGKSVDIIARWDNTSGTGFEQKFKGEKISYIPFANYYGFNFIIGAVSFQVWKNVWLIPNIKWAMYTAQSEKPDDHIYANLTFWWKFK